MENGSTAPVVAGDELPLSAYVYSKCEPSAVNTCGDVRVTLSFTTISGDVLTLTETYPHTQNGQVSFVIPGEYVHWWDTETRMPYVFGYWYDVQQVQGGIEIKARGPAAPNTKYEREVVTLVAVRYTTPSGAAAQGRWYLEVHNNAGSGTITRVASGDLIDGTAEVRIEPSDAVLDAALHNGGFANFILEVRAVDATGPSHAVTGFYSAFGDIRGTSRRPGPSIGVGAERPVEPFDPCDLIQPAGAGGQPCNVGPDVCTEVSIKERIGPMGGDVGLINAVYGTRAEFLWGGGVSDTDIQLGVKRAGRGWEAQAGEYHHVGTPATRDGVSLFAEGIQNQRAHISADFYFIHLKKREYDWVNGYCYAYESLESESYDEAGGRGVYYEPGVPTVGAEPNDCATSCTIAPNLAFTRSPGNITERNNDVFVPDLFNFDICYLVCLGMRSGYSEFAKTRVEYWNYDRNFQVNGASCNRWWVYHRGAADVPFGELPELRLDAGNKENNTVTAAGRTYPRGCEP